jgi:hypothetical protein
MGIFNTFVGKNSRLRFAGGILGFLFLILSGLIVYHEVSACDSSFLEPKLDQPTATIISDDIIADTTWDLAGSPYQVTTSIQVTEGVTLTVEQGVEVRFEEVTGVDIYGTLMAVGTSDKPITFTGTTKGVGWWNGITFNGTETNPNTGSVLDYVTIEYGGWYAALELNYASISVSYSEINYSGDDGILGNWGGVAHVSDTSFTGNQEYAIYFWDGSVNPVLSNLTASNNGYNGVAIGAGELIGEHVWEACGLPYYVLDDVTTAAGSMLKVEPGVEVHFDNYTGLLLYGILEAIGTPSQPILFTGTTATPGWWDGISIKGRQEKRNFGSILRFVTIEYGGVQWGNLNLGSAVASVSNAIIRYSSYNGVMAGNADGSVIERSQIVNNAEYGIRNTGDLIMAINNWWGDASGPTDESCNPNGKGDAILGAVAYKPFLTSSEAEPDLLEPAEALIFSVTPQRWFAPADGITRIWTEISLRDGNGVPLPGRKVILFSLVGDASQYGITDFQGNSYGYVTSTSAGEDELTAILEDEETCEFVRSPSSSVTFTDNADDVLMPGAQAPYMSDQIMIEPEPITRGVLTTVSALLTNPNDFAISVDASFNNHLGGIGLVFGPIGEVHDFIIPANSDGVISIPWTPVVSGYYCVGVQYNAKPVGDTLSTMSLVGEALRNIIVLPGILGSTEPLPGQEGENGESEDPLGEKGLIEKARTATSYIGHAQTVVNAFTDPLANIGGVLPNKLFNDILDWNFNAWTRGTQALGGDPPRQDYTEYAMVADYTFTPLQPDEDLSAERSAAANALMEASLDLTANLQAATLSLDRYAGAASAGEKLWAAQQAAAMIYYKKESGKIMLTVADEIDDFLQVLEDEGFQELPPSVDDYREYQDRLRSEGFSAEEIQAARTIGLTDEEIEAIRQERMAADPAEMARYLLPGMADSAERFRALGNVLINPPNFPTTGSDAEVAAQLSSNNLARVFDNVIPIPVRNSLLEQATVSFDIRLIDMPEDWMVFVTPSTMTMEAGESMTATVTIRPGAASVQGTQPRVAIEGYANEELLGGVVLDVIVPEQVYFDGYLRTYLPLLER